MLSSSIAEAMGFFKFLFKLSHLVKVHEADQKVM